MRGGSSGFAHPFARYFSLIVIFRCLFAVLDNRGGVQDTTIPFPRLSFLGLIHDFQGRIANQCKCK